MAATFVTSYVFLAHQAPFEKESTLKGKNLLLLGANSLLLEQTPFQKGGIDKICSSSIILTSKASFVTSCLLFCAPNPSERRSSHCHCCTKIAFQDRPVVFCFIT